jgi:hypothetical protein
MIAASAMQQDIEGNRYYREYLSRSFDFGERLEDCIGQPG